MTELTLAITTFNRYEMLLESFALVAGDDSLKEILILDDCSELAYWNKIKDIGKFNPKVRVIRQLKNRGMAINKRDAIAYAQTEWVIIFDSDNIMNGYYLDAIPEKRHIDTIYIPSFAKPNFSFADYNGMRIDAKTAAAHIAEDSFNMMLNCCNYVVPRDRYLSVFKEDASVKATDTISFAYHWLKEGNFFEVVPGMHYFHRVHKDSGFLKDATYNFHHSEHMRKLIAKL